MFQDTVRLLRISKAEDAVRVPIGALWTCVGKLKKPVSYSKCWAMGYLSSQGEHRGQTRERDTRVNGLQGTEEREVKTHLPGEARKKKSPGGLPRAFNRLICLYERGVSPTSFLGGPWDL